MSLPDRCHQRRFLQLGEVADGAHAQPFQPLQRGGPDAPQRLHRQWVQEGQLLTGPHLPNSGALDHPLRRCPWLGRHRCQLGQELAGGDAHRAAQLQLAPHLIAHMMSDLYAAAEQAQRAGDIEERLIERERFDERCHRLEDLVDLGAHLRIQLVVTREEDHVRAQSTGSGRRHRGVQTEAAGLVRGCRDDASRPGATDHHRLPAQVGSLAQLHAHVERIHVDVQDRSTIHRGGGRPHRLTPGVRCDRAAARRRAARSGSCRRPRRPTTRPPASAPTAGWPATALLPRPRWRDAPARRCRRDRR